MSNLACFLQKALGISPVTLVFGSLRLAPHLASKPARLLRSSALTAAGGPRPARRSRALLAPGRRDLGSARSPSRRRRGRIQKHTRAPRRRREPRAAAAMRLTADLVQHCAARINPVRERELDLRGYKLSGDH